MVGGGGGQPLLASVGTSGVTGEKGTMSKTSVDCGFMEMLPACTESRGNDYAKLRSYFYGKKENKARRQTKAGDINA